MDSAVTAALRRQVDELHQAGIPLSYIDPRWPGQTIREYADGRRVFVELDRERGVVEVGEVPELGRAADPLD